MAANQAERNARPVIERKASLQSPPADWQDQSAQRPRRTDAAGLHQAGAAVGGHQAQTRWSYPRAGDGSGARGFATGASRVLFDSPQCRRTGGTDSGADAATQPFRRDGRASAIESIAALTAFRDRR